MCSEMIRVQWEQLERMTIDLHAKKSRNGMRSLPRFPFARVLPELWVSYMSAVGPLLCCVS